MKEQIAQNVVIQMSKLLVKDTHITEFQVKRILKHKPIQIARMMIKMYGNVKEAENVALKAFPDTCVRERFIGILRQEAKTVEIMNWNRGKF